MKLSDLVYFDNILPSLYGFDSFYNVNEIKIYSGNINSALKNLRKYDVLYINNYEISLELFAKAKEQKKIFLISLSDILNSRNQFISLYRIGRFTRVARHYGLRIMIASMAKKEEDIRSPEEGWYILRLCGFTKEQVRYGYSLVNDALRDEV
jgi:hypothetical protein